jgi:predicted ArsR family transcriptional regulator
MGKPGPDPKVQDCEIVQAIIDVDEPVASTTDIANRIDLSNVQIRERLDKLQQEGVLRSKPIGNSSAWWVANLQETGVA